MKKIAVLLLLCMVLCASSAMAAQITFNAAEGTGSMEPENISSAKYTVPECTFNAPNNQKFMCWADFGTNEKYLPGDEIAVNGDKCLVAFWMDKDAHRLVIHPGSGNGKRMITEAYSNEPLMLHEAAMYGFTPSSSDKQFTAWWVVGEHDKASAEDFPEWGRLFARAIADEAGKKRYPDEMIKVGGPLTITALWGNETGADVPGGNTGGGQGGNGGGNGGGQAGGNGGVNGGVGEAASMPGTGDSSLPMAFLMLMLAASVGGIALLAKRRTN